MVAIHQLEKPWTKTLSSVCAGPSMTRSPAKATHRVGTRSGTWPALDDAQVDEAVAELATQRHLALDRSGNIVIAHPFTTVNLGVSVMGERGPEVHSSPMRGDFASSPLIAAAVATHSSA